MKTTLDLTRYDLQCIAHNWQSLGYNYTVIFISSKIPKPNKSVAFHKLNLDTAWTSIRIIVGDKDVYVNFVREGKYPASFMYPLNAVPRQPYQRPDRREMWDEFMKAVTTPAAVENLHENYQYDL